MQNVFVSIIIPTYNRAHLIAETLNTVLAQTYQNWECIVVDDGSNDDTDAVLEEYCKKDSRIKYYHRPAEHLSGGNGARNYGFIKCKGEFIKWFDSDDLMHENLLEIQVNMLTLHNVDLTFCNLKILNENYIFNSSDVEDKIDNLLHDFIIRKVKINLQVVLFKKNVVDKYKFDEKLKKAQDLDFIYEILRNKPSFSFTSKILCELRLHEQRISSNYQKFDKGTIFSSIKVKEKILFNEYAHLNKKEKKALLRQYTYELRLLLLVFEVKHFFYYLNRLKIHSFITMKEYLRLVNKFSYLAFIENIKLFKRKLVLAFK